MDELVFMWRLNSRCCNERRNLYLYRYNLNQRLYLCEVCGKRQTRTNGNDIYDEKAVFRKHRPGMHFNVALRLNAMQYSSKTMLRKPSVYIWSVKDKILYVGSTMTPERRLIQHLMSGAKFVKPVYRQWLKAPEKDLIETIFCKNKAKMLLLEKKLIRKHKPKFNKILYKNR